MRMLARLGVALAAVAALVATTTGVASAAPSTFDVSVKHSSGVLVGRIQGDLAWSTSGRTVSFTDQVLLVRNGECVELVYAGYQGNSLVVASDTFTYCETGPLIDIGLTADFSGGIQHVVIELTDKVHRNKASDYCSKTASVCVSRS